MTIFSEYTDLIRSLEKQCMRLEQRHAKLLQCRPGCHDCCKALSVLPIEAEIIRRDFFELSPNKQKPARDRAKNPDEFCPLLVDRLCLLYQQRPIICRTHGLAIAYIDEEQEAIEVSACPMNFPDGYEFSKEDLLFLDHFNEELQRLNSQFSEEFGMDPFQRHSIRGIIRACTSQVAQSSE